MGGFNIVKLTDPIQFTTVNGGLVPRGAYNGATDYAVGDSVDYNGSSYVMHTDAGAGTLPTDTTKWQVLANKGATGSTGSTGATGAAGADGRVLTVVAGTGISVNSTDPANPVITNTQTSAAWGNITGTLSSQTDLNTALAAKAPLASPTFTGTVTIPTGASITAPTGLVKGDVGLGNVDNTSNATERAATRTLTNARVTRRVVTVNAPGATPTTNTDNTDIAEFTGLAVAITSMTTNLSGTPVKGDRLEVWLTDNGTARAITWGASFQSGGTVALPTSTVISTTLRVLFEYDGTKLTCIAVS